MVTSRRGLRGVAKGQGVCYQWKAKKQCSRGDTCSFRYDGHERAKQTPKTTPPSVPPTRGGGSASRKKNFGGRSPSGKFDRQLCKNFLKGICTKSLCDCWHPPECQFYESESGCKFVDKCSFPQWEVQEQPNKRPKKGGDNSAVALLKDVRQLGCVFQDTEPPESLSILRKSSNILKPIRCVRSLGTNSTSTIRKSYAASCKHRRKQRSVARKNSSQSSCPRRRVEICPRTS